MRDWACAVLWYDNPKREQEDGEERKGILATARLTFMLIRLTRGYGHEAKHYQLRSLEMVS